MEKKGDCQNSIIGQLRIGIRLLGRVCFDLAIYTPPYIGPRSLN